MKTLKTVMIFFLTTLTVVSCSKDDDSKSSVSIIGNWLLTEQIVDEEVQEMTACEKKIRFVFSEETLTSYNYEGEDCEIEIVETFDYTLDGEKLILRSENLSVEYDVDLLSESTLILSTTLNDQVLVGKFKRL